MFFCHIIKQQQPQLSWYENAGKKSIILKTFENSGVLLVGSTDTISNKTEEQRGRFLCPFLGISAADLLWNLLLGKGIHRPDYGIYRLGLK